MEQGSLQRGSHAAHASAPRSLSRQPLHSPVAALQGRFWVNCTSIAGAESALMVTPLPPMSIGNLDPAASSRQSCGPQHARARIPVPARPRWVQRASDSIPRRFRFRVSALTFRRTRGETGDVVVDQEGVCDGDWDGPEKPRGHQRAPEVQVRPNQIADYADRHRFHVA